MLNRSEGVLGQVLVSAVEVAGLIAGIDLEPLNRFAAPIGLGHSGIDHFLGRWPDIHPGAIAADERHDRVVRHHRLAVVEADDAAAAGGCELLVTNHGMRKPEVVGIVSLEIDLRCHECRRAGPQR